MPQSICSLYICTKRLSKNKAIYYSPNTRVRHEGGKSHDNLFNYEMELSRNWHWMWSTFYYNKKHNGYLIALLIVLPKLFNAIFKFFTYSIFRNKEINYQCLSINRAFKIQEYY